MTDFLTALVVFGVLWLCCDQGRKKGVQFHLPYDHYGVCHKTEVLLCVLILSFLDTSICIGAVDTKGIQDYLKELRPIIQKSDALLYAPSIEKGEIGMEKSLCRHLDYVLVNKVLSGCNLFQGLCIDSSHKSGNLTGSTFLQENCKTVSLKCYLLELNVILLEEGIWDAPEDSPEAHYNQYIQHFSKNLMKSSQASSSDSCPPCEAQPLKNATIFLDRMLSLLQSMNQ